ncbi:hypothetical protein EI983_14475 [Roseovarius faecimaris]|uniref:Uncharacterized protein n=1 Tax=Roseovarius faecimaris TaxID=2494550 RepID=A0A6I6IT74_9RHOB|nr:hypothetical protein [Roseovarius faecimaris]QGX99402.1 hypothetical protein EI983_14475 [Roseovarius faecimaris]
MRVLALLLAGLAAPVAAQEVRPCDWIARADAIVEPWEAHSRTFANGAVRLALLDVIEPAAGAFHLLILSPPYDEVGGRQCRTLGLGQGMGFAQADFTSLTAGYDPAVGLIFGMEVGVMGTGGNVVPRSLGFTLNQATGAIATALQ